MVCVECHRSIIIIEMRRWFYFPVAHGINSVVIAMAVDIHTYKLCHLSTQQQPVPSYTTKKIEGVGKSATCGVRYTCVDCKVRAEVTVCLHA